MPKDSLTTFYHPIFQHLIENFKLLYIRMVKGYLKIKMIVCDKDRRYEMLQT